MPRTKFALVSESARYENYISQLRGIYAMDSEEEFIYEFYFDENSSQIPDSVVAIRKYKNTIALFTPFISIMSIKPYALTLYICKEAEPNKQYLVFCNDDYEAAQVGDSMRNGKHVQLIKV